jgi:hypothetical protein
MCLNGVVLRNLPFIVNIGCEEAGLEWLSVGSIGSIEATLLTAVNVLI